MIEDVEIGVGKNAVRTMTGRAIRDPHVPRLALEAVIAVDVGAESARGNAVLLIQDLRFVTRRAGGLGDARRADRRPRVGRRDDAVLSMAVGADRCVHLAASGELAVDALRIVPGDRFVTMAAGTRNVEMDDGRFGIGRAQDAVRGLLSGCSVGRVTVVTGGRHVQTFLARLAMNAALVQLDRLLAQDVMPLHQIDVGVTRATGAGEVDRVGVRLAIRRGEDVVVTVTVPALGEIRILTHLEAPVLGVDFGLVLVAPAAVDRLDLLDVWIVRPQVQVLHGDRFVARVAVLVAVDGFGQELVRRSPSRVVGRAIVAIGAFLGRGPFCGQARILGAGAGRGPHQGKQQQGEEEWAMSPRGLVAAGGSLGAPGDPLRMDELLEDPWKTPRSATA